MIFGLVTRRELEKRLAELDQDRKRELETIAFEWARWFDKFRSLYAMLLKREKKDGAAQVPGSDQEERQDATPLATPGRLHFPNSRRGF